MSLELEFKIKQIILDIELAQRGGKVWKFRDLIDPAEGYIRDIKNSNGNYGHDTLKYDASEISEAAAEIKRTHSKGETNKKCHREHALPLDMVEKELFKLINPSVEEVIEFLRENVISVLITKEERDLLDNGSNNLKKSMPEGWDGKNKFARFEAKNIRIVTK